MIRTAVGVGLLWLGVLIPSAVHAQESPGYDPNREITFTGRVADVKGGRSPLYWFSRIHTLGMGHMPAPERRLLLKTDTEIIEIQLGPSGFLDERNVEIGEGDAVRVTGSRVTVGDSEIVIAREIRKGDTVWALRSAAGQPLWSAAPTEPRRFWSTTKIVLVVVAAKVALLATVLSH